MRRLTSRRYDFLAISVSSALQASGPATRRSNVSKVHGRIQFVKSFRDYKVQAVTSFPDLRVEIVKSFPDKPGQWQIVESFPDYKIEMVNSFPDFTIVVREKLSRAAEIGHIGLMRPVLNFLLAVLALWRTPPDAT